MARKIVAVVENHFDQIWRRCFKRNLEWNGINYIPYAKIEQFYVDENLKIAEKYPEYKFQIENICAVETYFENRPENEPIIRQLYKDGRLKTTNTGYVILDSNMVGIEPLIRNYLISDEFFKKYMGKTPEIANRSDAFGNSAQLPQILKSFGAKYVTEIYYNTIDGDVWVGLDNTAVCVTDRVHIGGAGGWSKHPPCGECKGYGYKDGKACKKCEGKGIDTTFLVSRYGKVNLFPEHSESGIIRCGGEEILPTENTILQVEELKKTGVDIEIGHWDYLLEMFAKQIEQVESGDFTGLTVKQSPEFNPNTTGGYVTRIKIKQRLCDTENKLLAGEALSSMRTLSGKTPFDYSSEWRKFLLNGFHDSSSGTIVDAGYDEIMDMFTDIDNKAELDFLAKENGDELLLFNPTSFEYNGFYEGADGRYAQIHKLAPYGFCKAKLEKRGTMEKTVPLAAKKLQGEVLTGKEEVIIRENGDIFCIQNDYYEVYADNKGIVKIVDKRNGVISQTLDGVRPVEFILQSDNGSPWAVLEKPSKTESLKEATSFTGIEKSGFYTKICFRTEISMMTGFIPSAFSYFDWSLTLFDGNDKIRFNIDGGWYSSNKRLMVAFPLCIEDGRDIYGIPGGKLERQPYEPWYEWNGANGDYPAFKWAGVEGKDKSAALLNRGTPCYKIDKANGGKIMYITILRSPCNPVCLHEADVYAMNGYDGMRDEGHHSFTLDFVSYSGSFADSSIIRDAEQFYRPLLCVKDGLDTAQMPYVTNGTAYVSHIKPAEDSNGIIVRINETEGNNGKVKLSIPDWVKRIYLTDMPERKCEELSFDSGSLEIDIRGFELMTLRMCK